MQEAGLDGVVAERFPWEVEQTTEDIVALFSTPPTCGCGRTTSGTGVRPDRRRGGRRVRRARVTDVSGLLYTAKAEMSSAGLADAEHRRDDAVVAGTPPEAPLEPDPHLVLGRRRVAREERRGGDEHARRAEAALDAAEIEERRLQRR